MALDETITWIACPNGLGPAGAGPTYRLSVFVSPRLTATAPGLHTLNEWPDWLHWASRTLRFGVQFDDGTGAAAGTVLTFTNDSVPAIWDRIFTAGVAVENRVLDTYPTVPVLSYPMTNVASFLEDQYGAFALSSPDDHPLVSDLAAPIGQIGFAGPDGQKRRDAIVNALTSERNGQGPNGHPLRANTFTSSSPARDFVALDLFHRSRSSKRILPVQQPTLDFHKIVSMAGNHPGLLRKLGLVFDLIVAPPALNNPIQRVRVTQEVALGGGGVTYTTLSPWTRCTLTGAAFEAAAKGPTVVSRFLKIGDTNQFDVLEIDPDGGGLKLAHLADNLKLASINRTDDTPDRQSLPSLREAGFSVAQKERSTALVQRFNRAETLEAGADDLFAEDITRGHVLDVWDGGRGAWSSTGARVGTYHFPGAGGPADVPIDDEAPFSSPPTSSANPADPKEFRLQESLVRWDGWSLAGPRPGLAIQANDVVGPDPAPTTPWGVDIQVRPKPGSLPRLRFGRAYGLRLRAMDIAGNVLPLATTTPVPDPQQRTAGLQTYHRFDPVVSPDVLIRQTPAPGESGGKIVIRGNYDLDSPDISVRYVAPPRASQMLAELHEEFEAAIGTGSGAAQVAAYALITGRESEHYPPAPAVPDVTVPVPFLPDPLAKGATVRVMGGPLAGSFFDLNFRRASAWPDYQPFELRLMHGPAPAFVPSDAARRMDVTLGKADVVDVRLSCTMDPGDPAQFFGIRHWASKRAGFPAVFDANAAAGKHWMLTPFRTLTLIYAVRQPLVVPTFGVIDASRSIGDTFADVRGTVLLSAKSTGQLDLEARWTEPLDLGPGTPAPDEFGLKGRGHAFAIRILADDQDFSGRHEFHDTKHRNVDYWLVATSKFAEHFVESQQLVSPAIGSPIVLDPLGLQPERVKVLRAGAELRRGVAFTTDDALGTITFLAGAAADHVQVGDTVDLSFLPPVSRQTPDPAHRVVNVRSSARPLSPDVAFVVPIFEWSPVATAGGVIRSRRTGAGVRVYLNRPWWSSGEGELLGVVTWPPAEGQSPPAAPREIRSFVTQWGHDPVFSGATLPTVLPRLSSFPASAPGDRRANLSIDERPGQKVNVAGHHLGYDPVHDLYYCDIPVEVGNAYTPFIRLALARYQPDSILDAELSRVVLVDFLQLTPDRSATIVMKSSELIGTITLTGPSYVSASGRHGPGYAQAIIERRDPSIADDDLGWRPVGGPHPMSAGLQRGGIGVWIARQIPLPAGGGMFRVVLEQYEELATDNRSTRRVVHGLTTARRLVYTDVVPIA